MNLTPYPNLLLQMPPPNHVVHTAKKQQERLIQQSQSTEKIILSEGEADPQNVVLMFTCCKTSTIAHKLSQAKVELQSTIHSRPLDFDFIDLGEGQVSSRDRVSKTINNQSFKRSLCTSWGVGQLHAGKKQTTSFRLNVCTLQSLQGRDLCVDSPSPLQLSGRGGWGGRILPIHPPRQMPVNFSACSEWALFWSAGLQCFAIKQDQTLFQVSKCLIQPVKAGWFVLL